MPKSTISKVVIPNAEYSFSRGGKRKKKEQTQKHVFDRSLYSGGVYQWKDPTIIREQRVFVAPRHLTGGPIFSEFQSELFSSQNFQESLVSQALVIQNKFVWLLCFWKFVRENFECDKRKRYTSWLGLRHYPTSQRDLSIPHKTMEDRKNVPGFLRCLQLLFVSITGLFFLIFHHKWDSGMSLSPVWRWDSRPAKQNRRLVNVPIDCFIFPVLSSPS